MTPLGEQLPVVQMDDRRRRTEVRSLRRSPGGHPSVVDPGTTPLRGTSQLGSGQRELDKSRAGMDKSLAAIDKPLFREVINKTRTTGHQRLQPDWEVRC